MFLRLFVRSCIVVFFFAGFSISTAKVLITELAPWNNGAISDEEGEYPGWIELHNTGAEEVSLEFWAFSLKAGEKSWVFPAVSLPPEGYIVVFGSGKNKRIPGSPLHTSFVLTERMSLSLLRPDGNMESALQIPEVPVEVSYGFETITNATSLVFRGMAGKFLVPTDDGAGRLWTQAEYDDAGWTSVLNGVGYETNSAFEPFGVIADSSDDFSGVQGQRGWYYGYYHKTADPDRTYQAPDFIPFPNDAGPFGPTNYWTGEWWDWWPADPPWTTIRRNLVHPNSGIEHWAIRRWKSHITGPILINMEVRMAGGGGDGTTTWVFLNGSPVFKRGMYGVDPIGISEQLELNVKKDDLIDFANSPDGRAVAILSNDSFDSTTDHYKIQGPLHLKNSYQTDVQTLMHGKNSSAYLRLPFDLPSIPKALNFDLKIKYDAGFVAYLNGTEVARRLAGHQTLVQAVQADSLNDFSGIQGEKNWHYGYYVRSSDSDLLYQPEDFIPFAGSDFDGNRWALGPGDPPWTEITRDGGHPNGSNNGSVHWAIRRWQSPVSGNLSVTWTHKKGNLLGGNGTSVHLFHNDQWKGTTVVDPNNGIGITNKVILRDVRVGDFIDLALDAAGGNPTDENDSNDGTIYTVLIESLPGDALSWNARALAERDEHAALTEEVIDLKEQISLLNPGKNVLAIHGLNSSSSDEDFLLEPELILTDRRILLHPSRYFTQPTPGTENVVSLMDSRYFRILGLQPTADQVTVNWDARPGNHYQILYKSNLQEMDWVPLGQITADSVIQSIDVTPASPGFFRVEYLF